MVLREARRFLMSSPLLSLAGVVVLALGIGSSTLALVLLMKLSSLSYPGMQTKGYATLAEETEGGGSVQIAWRRFAELRASSPRGVVLSAYSKPIDAMLQANGGRRPLRVSAVSSGFFPAFTHRMTAGRDFSEAEEGDASEHAVILSAALAAELFRQPAEALDRFAILNGIPYQVVGVATTGFDGMFGDPVEAWVPANCLIPLLVEAPGGRFSDPSVWMEIAAFYGVAASDRTSSEELVADLSRAFQLNASSEAPFHISPGLTTDPGRDARLRRWLRLGFLLTLIFTVVSSLNYSLLLLARTPRYVEEVRLKKALGAGSSRLIVELMIGPAAMVGAGVAFACLICAGGLILISRTPGFYGQLVQSSWRAAFMAFGPHLALACFLTLLVALIPAPNFLRRDNAPRMGRTSTAARRTSFLLQVPVTLQIASCVGTCILAGMIISSFIALMREPLGYNPNRLTVVCIGPGPGGVSFTVGGAGESRQSFPAVPAIENLLDRVAAIPGVRGVSYASAVPFDRTLGTLAIQRFDGSPSAPRTTNQIGISSGYFQTMGTRILRGRDFQKQRSTGGTSEIIVNEVLARELWQRADPVDRVVRLINPAAAGMPSFATSARVVAVVEDMRTSGFSESPAPTVFVSLYGAAFFDMKPHLVVRGAVSIDALRQATGRQVPDLIPGMGVLSAYGVAERVDASLIRDRRRVFCALAGALMMALVACIGLYGALAYYVGTRRRELAVRMCLGASPWTIRRIVVARGAMCAAVAVILCLPVWPLLAQLSTNEYLGRVSWSFGRAVLISLACASLSVLVSLVPAMAASSGSPSDALKDGPRDCFLR